MKKFEEILGFTQEKLRSYLSNYLCGVGYKINTGDGYVFAKGDIPVLLIAHMDTACNKQIPHTILKENTDQGIRLRADGTILGGDDRCGCWMIMNIIKKAKCSVLFLEDEEIGCVGARKFVKTEHVDYIKDNVSFMIELDRRGNNDCVFYSCDNREFVKYVEEKLGAKETLGSCSDISTLMPETKTAGVNLSCGYYREHTPDEYIMISEMEDMMERLINFLTSEEEFPAYEFIQKKYSYPTSSFGDLWARDSYGWNNGNYGKRNRRDNRYPHEIALDDMDDLTLTCMMNEDYVELYGSDFVESVGTSKADCWARLFLENPEISFDMIFSYEWS